MTVTAYATLDEFTGQLEATSSAPVDDIYINALLERASREFDGDTQHWFYAYTQTRTFDLPLSRELVLDAPLLTVTTLTNGDSTTIPSTEYNLLPYNGPHHNAVKLKVNSVYIWQYGANAATEGVVSVAGSWGYVDRAATDPESLRVISNTKTAVLALALAVYRKRYGVGTEGAATITGAGVVITPRDKSKEYWSLVSLYQRHL
jgi:hypothetical protein